MVNFLLKNMDNYGLIEPTDVGTISIDYDTKDDLKRKISRWEHDETACMLNFIKENNFMNRFSVIRMSSFLSQMMQKKGYNRTDKQIQMKLTMLRKHYLAFTRQKESSNNIKECPFYKELFEVYSKVDENGCDSDESDGNAQDDVLINFPNDPIAWSKSEVKKMLNQIKYMKLKNELTLTFFSPMAMKMIAESMQKLGYERDTSSVKNALLNLRSMYIDYKLGCENNENPPECMFLSCLDLYWGKEFKKCRLKELKKTKPEESWSTEETIVLLTLIQDLNIKEEAYKNTEKAAEDLRLSLADNGHTRTKQQVINRLLQLKKEFVSVHMLNSEVDAVRKFPFYNLYKKLFEKHISYDENRTISRSSSYSPNASKNSQEHFSSFTDVKGESPTENVYWTNEEVRILLKTVQEMTSKSILNESFENEKLQSLVKVLAEFDYHKTAAQIKSQLALLKSSYDKCNQEDSSENDIFNCPFYNELHNIFHTPVSDKSYADVNIENGSLESGENKSNDKVTVLPNKCIDTWYPVESIPGDDGTSSSALVNGLVNENSMSEKEQQQIVEEVVLETFPCNNDMNTEENHVITENVQLSLDLNGIQVKNDVHSINDVVIDQEVETTTEINYANDTNKSISERSESQMSTDSISLKTSCPNEGENEGPPSKKPRIIEDEKFGKNTLLLRPVNRNPMSLQVAKPMSKLVRLIIANDRPMNKSNLVNHITAHIEPLSINTTAAATASNSSVSSELSSPVDNKFENTKSIVDKLLKGDVAQRLQNEQTFVTQQQSGVGSENNSTTTKCLADLQGDKISQTIKDAMQTMITHDELMQQRHHTWMEQQFEIQRTHEEEQSKVMIKELQELRKCISVLIASNVPHVNNQRRPF